MSEEKVFPAGEERIYAAGKINLFLFITGKLPSGYHELETLFMPLPGPQDILVFRPASRDSGIAVSCTTPGIDLEKNTLTRAYGLYVEATGFAPAVDVELVKKIPHGAGLGGGSADGAQVLLWLQRHAPEPLPEEKLLPIAARVGADVPFFLKGVPCLAQGIGERLFPVESGVRGMSCVLVCPHVHVDTAWAYAAWDAERASFSLTEKTKADKNNRSSYQSFYGRNDFEPVVFAAHPELAALKMQLLQEGADIAGMSGSGSALFGLFRDPVCAAQGAAALQKGQEKAQVFGPFLF
ncbi:4-(cytidine 5'-diphospho)-2-C-methyl-D-erythritol kinase [Mailhella massiliensis]|uniref:4-diphosphocytidyl-2-C-methyl-D-erythritol kinase n=1 Tax=Mailhella massiliensis TaxID=1903261 RepID=A0A921AWT0_9BACT|nr:4-(cytidine 5'-diphospho)-2-C-methyl-D-erythritol kinase [Mailhella massiliensis]HJD97282.1 4-(cytidine 5'-diphospho)-2-C-methyl-D-erythritol kinase [Mailhella massiliensis]